MTNEQIRAIIKQQTEQRIEDRHKVNIPPDVWTTSNITCSFKYITEDGRVRLDIDYDTFKELFDQAIWNKNLLELQLNNKDLMRATPYRVRKALDIYRLSDSVAELCELIRLVRPMFDYRKKPR